MILGRVVDPGHPLVTIPGCPHATDIPYLFGYPMLQFNDAVKNNTGLWFAPVDWNMEDVEFSNLMITFWVNFAKTG